MKKKGVLFLISCISCSMMLAFSAWGSEPATSKEYDEVFNINEIAEFQDKTVRCNVSNEIVITDPEIIKELAVKQGFPNVDKIKRLVYTVGGTSVESETQPRQTIEKHIDDVSNKGGGFTLAGHYEENRYEGPMTGAHTFSKTDTCVVTGDISVGMDLVSAAVGFTIGEERTVSDTVTLNIPAGENRILQIWTNFEKTTFQVYNEYSDSPGLWYPAESGSAYRPIGLIFTQAEY